MKLNEDGTIPVAVDGSYSSWGSWQPCSQTCGGGSQGRSRTYEPPINGGQEFSLPVGESTFEVGRCNEQNCPVDGTWTTWSSWCCTTCCGRGLGSRSRGCNPPRYGGKDCEGPAEESGQVCNACKSDDVCFNGTAGTIQRFLSTYTRL